MIQDREVTLYDGTRFVSPWRWKLLMKSLDLTPEDLFGRGLRCTHPTFRLIALATPNDSRSRSWLTNEALQLFHFFTLPPQPDLLAVVKAVPNCPEPVVRSLLRVRQLLYEASQDSSSALWAGNRGQVHVGSSLVMLSLRSILRAARTAAAAPASVDIASEIGEYLHSALMTDFMPLAESTAVLAILRASGFVNKPRAARLQEAVGMTIEAADLEAANPVLQIGTAFCSVRAPEEKTLVPETKFFHNPQQTLAFLPKSRSLFLSWAGKLLKRRLLLIVSCHKHGDLRFCMTCFATFPRESTCF